VAVRLPFRWLCGGVGVNHRMLSDFRTDHGEALDKLFTQVIATLVDQELVTASRVSQDGVRVRGERRSRKFSARGAIAKTAGGEQAARRASAAAGGGAGEAVGRSGKEEGGAVASGRREAETRGAGRGTVAGHERATRRNSAPRGPGQRGQKIQAKQLRVSTSDPEARVMKMANGGYNPAFNVQLANDARSRAIVGVEVTNEGSDSAGLSESMREQVERRSGARSSSI
jgi:hypothetical protein